MEYHRIPLIRRRSSGSELMQNEWSAEVHPIPSRRTGNVLLFYYEGNTVLGESFDGSQLYLYYNGRGLFRIQQAQPYYTTEIADEKEICRYHIPYLNKMKLKKTFSALGIPILKKRMQTMLRAEANFIYRDISRWPEHCIYY